jgi:hypothetical protein
VQGSFVQDWTHGPPAGRAILTGPNYMKSDSFMFQAIF